MSHGACMCVLEVPFSLRSPFAEGWMPLPAANHLLTPVQWSLPSAGTQSALPLLILRRVYLYTLNGIIQWPSSRPGSHS